MFIGGEGMQFPDYNNRSFFNKTTRKSKLKLVATAVACMIFAVVVATNLLFISLSGMFSHPPWEFFLGNELPGFYTAANEEQVYANIEFGYIIESLILTPLSFDIDTPEKILESQFAPARHLSPKILAMTEEKESLEDHEKKEDGEEQQKSTQVMIHERTKEELQDISGELVDDPEIVTEEKEDSKVAIYHSHTTESFVPDSGEPFVENLDKTVVQLGRKLTDELANYDIGTVHSEEIHDLPSRRESYARSLPTVEQILEDKPDTDVVLDLHRDGIPRDATTAEIEGEKVGKVLILVGSEGNPNWRENYQFALQLQKELEQIHPELSRGIRTQNFSYNQEVHTRSLLIEVGGHENSLQEAKNTVPYLAEAINNAVYNAE